jgi:hypothetical protein
MRDYVEHVVIINILITNRDPIANFMSFSPKQNKHINLVLLITTNEIYVMINVRNVLTKLSATTQQNVFFCRALITNFEGILMIRFVILLSFYRVEKFKGFPLGHWNYRDFPPFSIKILGLEMDRFPQARNN